MDTDILKPDTGYLTVIERPSASSPNRASPDLRTPSDSVSYTEPVSEGEEDEDMDLAPARDEHKRTGLSGAEVEAAIAYREQMLKERRESTVIHSEKAKSKQRDTSGDDRTDGSSHDSALSPPKPRPSHGKTSNKDRDRALSIDPLAPSSAFDETLKTRLNKAHADRQKQIVANGEQGDNESQENPDDLEDLPQNDQDRILTRNWVAPPGKRISVPIRIEPKVYFAAERTFLVSTFSPIIYFRNQRTFPLLEMAQQRSVHSFDSHNAVELRSPRRFPGTYFRCVIYLCGASRNCIRRWNICLPCIQAPK